MEPRSNIEKPKDRKVKRQKNQKTEDMEIIEIKKDQQQYISAVSYTHLCDLLHTLPRRPHQRTPGPAPDYGKCRPHGTVDSDWTERTGAGSQLTSRYCAGTAISDKIHRNHTAGADI